MIPKPAHHPDLIMHVSNHLRRVVSHLSLHLTVGDDDGAWLYEGTVELCTALRHTLLFFSRVFRARYR